MISHAAIRMRRFPQRVGSLAPLPVAAALSVTPASNKHRTNPPRFLSSMAKRQADPFVQLNFIGLGKIGSTVCNNIAEAQLAAQKEQDDGKKLFAADLPGETTSTIKASGSPGAATNTFDKTFDALRLSLVGFDPSVEKKTVSGNVHLVDDIDSLLLSKSAETVDRSIFISALPNDPIMEAVFLDENGGESFISKMGPGAVHVSMSTISIEMAKKLHEVHQAHGSTFISSPVFARPDGLANKQAYFPIAGDKEVCKELVMPILRHTTTPGNPNVVRYFGSEPHLANTVKITGNFLIAATIESLSEAFDMAESNGVERNAVHEFLSGSIFDCLIHKGYGHRVAAHDHTPYENAHFTLELGHKDVMLAKAAAASGGKAPGLPSPLTMPIAEILDQKFTQAKKEGLAQEDWSAVSLIKK